MEEQHEAALVGRRSSSRRGVLLGAQAQQVDPALPAYQRTSGVSGSLNSVGSDTMNNMMTLWAETFRKFYPNVKIQVEGQGIVDGAAGAHRRHRAVRSDVAADARDRDRPVRGEVRLQADRAPTSYDALAVYVHKDNPIEKLTLAQVEAIFGKSRSAATSRTSTTWGQLGLTGDWANRPISLYGRNSASGTYGFFKEHALKNGDYKDTVKEQPGSASVVQGVTEDRFGIGYSGIGYRTSGVKAVPLAETDKGPFSDGSYADVQSGKYPLWRFLYIYVNKAPGKPLDPLAAEFLKLMFSKEGQEAVVKDGYMPLSAKQAQEELAKISEWRRPRAASTK